MYTIEDFIKMPLSKVCQILNKYAHKSEQRLTQIQLLEQKLLIVRKCFFKLKENDLNKKEFSKLIEEVEEIIGINPIIPKNGE